MMPTVYEVISRTMGGKSRKLFGNYDDAAEQYNKWVEYFEELKADGEEVQKVILNKIENGKVTLMAEHF